MFDSAVPTIQDEYEKRLGIIAMVRLAGRALPRQVHTGKHEMKTLYSIIMGGKKTLAVAGSREHRLIA